ECSRCEKPHENINAKFSTNWNQCSEFNCGDNSIMIFKFSDSERQNNDTIMCVDNDKTPTWKWEEAYIQPKSVSCEYICEQQNPLYSTCDPQDTQCKEVSFDNPNTCRKSMHFST
ncbi:hypothetical protein PENTCL1PPCAC_690, partial [Pristionchus entomophagus]